MKMTYTENPLDTRVELEDAESRMLWHIIQVQRQSVRIDTEWSARCCAQTSTYELPRSIVEAEDPAGAARHWASEQNRTKAHARVERAHAELRAAQAAYDRALELNHL